MVLGLENYISNQYLRALAVVVLVFVVLRIVLFIIEKVILRATRKTKTEVDDKFIKKSSAPFSLLIMFIGLSVAIRELEITQSVGDVVNNIIYSLSIAIVAYIVYLFIDIIVLFAINRAIKGKGSSAVKDSLISLFRSFLKVIMVVVAFLYILNTWGIEIGPFLAGLGIAGIAIAFALQNTLSNIFGGISVILDRSVKVGDLVYLDDQTRGRVTHVGLRSTKILTFDNELIIVPNGRVADGSIHNVGEPEAKSRVVIPFGAAYGSDVDKVKRIVLAEIKKVKNFIEAPEPSVMFLEMGDSALNFKAFFYVNSYENRFGAIDEATTKIYNVLNKHNIGIPFPQMDVHVKK